MENVTVDLSSYGGTVKIQHVYFPEAIIYICVMAIIMLSIIIIIRRRQNENKRVRKLSQEKA